MSSTNTFKFVQNNICITHIIFLIISRVWAQTRCQQSSTDGKDHATSKQNITSQSQKEKERFFESIVRGLWLGKSSIVYLQI